MNALYGAGAGRSPHVGIIYGIDRVKGDPMSRTVLLVEVEGEMWDQVDEMECVKFVELRQYDMKDPEQCAIQFVREMIIQGRTPDPETQRLVVIGGDMLVKTLADAPTPMPVTEVPFSVWVPVPPPPTPLWTARKVA
jgi:hypothetical protein